MTLPRLPHKSGDKFKPRTEKEAEAFEDAFCKQCSKLIMWEAEHVSDRVCDIYERADNLGVDDPAYPRAWQWGETGVPTCIHFDKKTWK